MNAGHCTVCSGTGVRPSKRDPSWMLVCLTCNGTGYFPPPPNALVAWWYRVTDRIDVLLKKLGVL